MITDNGKKPAHQDKELPQDQSDDVVKEDRDAEVGQNDEPEGDRPGPED